MDNLKTSEADMGYVRDFVQKIAEALVSATELPKQIEAIQASMTTLSSDLERTKARNIELDTLLNDTRRQRDEAEQVLSQVKAQLNEAHQSLTTAENNSNTYHAQLEEVRSRLEQAKKERDDYGLKHMEAEDRAKTAEDKLAKLADALGLPKAAPTPVATPEPVKPVATIEQLKEQYSANAPQAQSYQPPQTEPTPEKRIYEGDWGYNELSFTTEKFDPEQKRYYRTA